MTVAERAVAASMELVPTLIAWDAPIFAGASREEQRAAVLAAGGSEHAPGGQIGGQLLTDGSVSPAIGGSWRLPALPRGRTQATVRTTAHSIDGDVPFTAAELAAGVGTDWSDVQRIPVSDADGEIVGEIDPATGEYEPC